MLPGLFKSPAPAGAPPRPTREWRRSVESGRARLLIPLSRTSFYKKEPRTGRIRPRGPCFCGSCEAGPPGHCKGRAPVAPPGAPGCEGCSAGPGLKVTSLGTTWPATDAAYALEFGCLRPTPLPGLRGHARPETSPPKCWGITPGGRGKGRGQPLACVY